MNKSETYKEAARMLAEQEHYEITGGYSCLALAKASCAKYDGCLPNYQSLPMVREYTAIMSSDGTYMSSGDFPSPDSAEGRHERIIALLFMSAIAASSSR